jgi:hypothetical protein
MKRLTRDQRHALIDEIRELRRLLWAIRKVPPPYKRGHNDGLEEYNDAALVHLFETLCQIVDLEQSESDLSSLH